MVSCILAGVGIELRGRCAAFFRRSKSACTYVPQCAATDSHCHGQRLVTQTDFGWSGEGRRNDAFLANSLATFDSVGQGLTHLQVAMSNL